ADRTVQGRPVFARGGIPEVDLTEATLSATGGHQQLAVGRVGHVLHLPAVSLQLALLGPRLDVEQFDHTRRAPRLMHLRGSQGAPVRTEQDAIDRHARRNRPVWLASFDVPEAEDRLETRRGERPAIGREGEEADRRGGARQGGPELVRAHPPEPDQPGLAARGPPPAGRRKGGTLEQFALV